ncbi:MAG: inositol monophosphatase family protein [Gallionella sp.]|nr:inositol monophosphatase family protein [Gallionella sp.]MDD4945285.1 inositol monophosphatase family protein [Gallionella sp.]MDD5612370.1 inositol monophosphatase family protein [Gallionella sp.]
MEKQILSKTGAFGMSALLKATVAAVKLVAAEEIMPRYLKVAHQQKSDGSLCTEADLATQNALTRKLQALCNVPVLGEEMTDDEQRQIWKSAAEGLWCIDPIDGTSNFVHGLPYFAVSVALMRDGKSVLGVVYDPVSDEMFAAEAGKGAYLNGEKMFSREVVTTMNRALANVDLKRLDTRLVEQLAIHPPYASQRNFGASALDWCYTAAGRYDLYLHGGQKLWDYAAGSLILSETCGYACCIEHDDFAAGDVWQRSVIAARNEVLFGQWKKWIRAHRGA